MPANIIPDDKDFVPVLPDLSSPEHPSIGRTDIKPASLTIDDSDKGTQGYGAGDLTPSNEVVKPDLSPKFGDPDNPDIWSPNSDVSPEDNISDLYSWLYNFIQNAGVYDINIDYLAYNYLRVMRTIAQSTKNLFDSIGYERKDNQGAIIDIIEKVTNIAQGYLDQIFTQALNYQSWYLQQEYNSPVNQLKRLEEAGLSSAFFFGSFSNSASSPAGSAPSSGASAQMSGAGAALEQGRANSIANRQSIFEAAQGVGELIDKGITSFKTIAEADNIRKLTPVQVASGIQEFKNLGVLNHYYSSQIHQIENDMISSWFKNDFASFQQDIQSAGQRVKNAQSALDNASTEAFQLAMGSKYVQTEEYVETFRNKEGKDEERSFTFDDLKSTWENGGKDANGNVIFDENDYNIEGSASRKVGVSAFPISASGQLGVKGSYGGNHGSRKSDESETNYSNSHSQDHQDSHFDASTQTLTLGNKKFKRVTGRKLMSSPEYVSYMKNLQSELIHSMDYFNALSTGERARAFQNFQLYLDNKALGLKWSSLGKLRYYLNQSTNPKINVGD